MSWNHLAATISRSNIPVEKISIARGQRYSGKSRMKFTRLISHGLSAMSVFLDIMMIRVLLVSTLIMGFSLLGLLVVVMLRFFTDLAIPGWATTATGIFAVLGLQALILSTVATFIILQAEGSFRFVPAIDSHKYIREIEKVYIGQPE
jgi:hypothetical protein